MWPQRADAMILTCKNEDVAKKTRKLAKKNKNTRKIILEKINTDEDNNLKIQQGKFVKGDNANVDAVVWEKGLSENVEKNEKIVFVRINVVLEPQVKSLNESRGLVIADYQNYLEQEWIKGLREKYNVEVKKEVFSIMLKETESEQNEKN
ncbi:MAG: hypothetical protein JKY33_09085 [Bacteroidia bacterium]|nr:hypothetical protein [Bacteroidia bacterium]